MRVRDVCVVHYTAVMRSLKQQSTCYIISINSVTWDLMLCLYIQHLYLLCVGVHMHYITKHKMIIQSRRSRQDII